MPWKITFTLHFLTQVIIHSSSSTSLVRVTVAPLRAWPLAISDLHSVWPIDSCGIERWHPPEPCWARRCEGDPVVFSMQLQGHCLSAFAASQVYPPSDAEHHVLVLVLCQACNMARDKRRWRKMSPMVDTLKHLCIGDIQHTSSICRWHLIWKPSSVFMLATNRVYVRAKQTLSVLGTGVLWCWYRENCNSIPSVENSSLNRQVQSCV